jgi:ParB family chromosome partitioning protein
MRLLSLGNYAREQLVRGKITQGHAKTLVGLDEKKQKIMIDSIIGQKLSVRDVEKMVKSNKKPAHTASPAKAADSLLDGYAEELAELLPFKHKTKAKSIEITFKNTQDIINFLTFLKNR